MAVVPTVRRTGLGFSLLAAAIELATSLGARAFFLEVSVTNIAARALYTKAGFIQAGRRRRYYSDASDALVLRLDIRPNSVSVRRSSAYLPRRINKRLIPPDSVSTDNTSCPCSVAVRGTFLSGSSPLSRTRRVSPGDILSKASRVRTNVIGQISFVMSISRVASCIDDTSPHYSAVSQSDAYRWAVVYIDVAFNE